MKKNTFKIIYVVVFILAVLFASSYMLYKSGIFDKDPVVETKAENTFTDTLKVLTDRDYMPYSFYDDNNTISGYDIELINMVANKMHVNLQLVPLDWQSAIEMITSGNADVLMTCDYSDSFEGVEKLAKSQPTSMDEFIVYSKKNITSINQLYGKKVGVMKNGNAASYVENMKLNLVYCYDNRAAMQAVINDEIDCAIIRNSVGDVLLTELKARKVKACISVGQSYMCYGIDASQPELVDKINEALTQIRIDGEIDRLQEKWLTSFIRVATFKEVVEKNVWVIFILIVILAFLVVTYFAYRESKLKQEREKNNYIELVDILSNDFECVNFVTLEDSKQDDTAILLRISDTLARNIPSWKTETKFTRRLDLMRNSIVIGEDKKYFYDMTRREKVLNELKNNGVYFVNFRAHIDDEVKYFQLKFATSTERGENEELKNIICGVHDIDEDTKKNVVIKEQLEKSLEASRKAELKLAEDKVILDYFLDAYNSAYSVDLENDKYEILYMQDSFVQLFRTDGGKGDMERFINDHIKAEDQPMIRQMIDKEYVMNRLKTEPYFTFTITEVFGETERLMRGLIVRGIDEAHVAVGFMDITAEMQKEKDVQKKLQDAANELENANRAKTDFLFNMSHDIRTPMNAIIGFTDLAKKYIDDKERVNDSLDKIKASSGHLLELINEVLDMSRVEAGKLKSEMKVVNIIDEGSKLITISKETANKKNIKLSYITTNVKNTVILADVLHTNQIVMNILGNAIKYTMPGGSVAYTIEEMESNVAGYGKYKLIIQDTGIGMSKEFISKIFDPFSREETATISGIQGTGLGMSIVKRLVDYMDGVIDVKSEVNHGTTISVILHFKLANIEDMVDEANSANKVNFKDKKVLLVEDNDLNREIATELLTEEGMIVEEAVNGLEAVHAIHDKGPKYYDFVLMDIQMPFMNGYEATQAIRKIKGTKDLTIIALSANAFEEDKKKSLEAGMNDHVAKPINIKELNNTISKYIK